MKWAIFAFLLVAISLEVAGLIAPEDKSELVEKTAFKNGKY